MIRFKRRAQIASLIAVAALTLSACSSDGSDTATAESSAAEETTAEVTPEASADEPTQESGVRRIR